MKKLLLIGLIALSSGSITYAGEIADLHQKLVGSKSKLWNNADRPDVFSEKKSGINEIGLERSGCYGKCPVYTVVLKSDGSVRYKGERYVENIGVKTGRIDSWKFEQLAKYIKNMGYMELQNTYASPVTDNATVYTTVRIGNTRKVISNYANRGPAKLWGIEELIDKLVYETKWYPVKADAQKKE